jgi:hypothetical protein
MYGISLQQKRRGSNCRRDEEAAHIKKDTRTSFLDCNGNGGRREGERGDVAQLHIASAAGDRN